MFILTTIKCYLYENLWGNLTAKEKNFCAACGMLDFGLRSMFT